MALDDVFSVTHPASQNGGVDPLALIIEEVTGAVEGTLNRKSIMKGWVPVRAVKGTSTITNFAVGESTLQKITQDGSTPDSGSQNDFSKNSLTIDTPILARATLPILEPLQTSYDARQEIGREHGKKIAKFWDQTHMIQAIKASLRTESKFATDPGTPAGHFGGSIETLAAAGDATDPAKLYRAISNLMVKMQLKDVDPAMDDCIIVTKPAQFYALLDAEQLVQRDYITSEGNKVQGGFLLKAFGVPIYSTLNYPGGSNIAGHLLSNAGNGNAYDGDFTKALFSCFSPRALLAGETIPLTTKVFWDEKSKLWFVDAYMAYGATVNRAEFAGSIYLP
jgi:hypothetical protein